MLSKQFLVVLGARKIFGITIAETLRRFNVIHRGGGWIESAEFVSAIHVDWVSKQFRFTLIDGDAGAVRF